MQQQSIIQRVGGTFLRATRWASLRFLGARGGGVAVPFALLAVPLTFMSIAAVDFHRASMIKSSLQDALDAATLTVGRSTATDPAQVQSMGAAALTANLEAYPESTLTSATFALQGTKVVSSASLAVEPLAADLLGGDLQVSANSEVVRAVYKLEVAMVLDNTGSMAGTKLSTLKTAAANFVDTLAAASARSTEANAVKIGLVPFSMTVNVGAGYQTAAWMDTAGASPINDQFFSAHANRFTLFQQMGVAWGGCVESRQAPYDVQETAPDPATPATLFTPYFAPDEPNLSGSVNSYLPDGTTSSSWTTRQNNVAKYNQAPTASGVNGTGVYKYGPNAGCELQPVKRLTTDWTSLKTAINGMIAIGDTNIPMGLAWGWHLLSPSAPFADGVAYDTPKTKKIVVLMTDGQNASAVSGNTNASYYSGVGYIFQNRLGITSGTAAQRQTAMDSRLTLLCQNMKAQDIQIYTVRVEVNDNNYSVLQGCATKPENFYDVQSASELNAVFNAIAGDIQNLRISH